MSNNLKLEKLEVKSFTTALSEVAQRTIAGGKDTTPDNTPLTSKDKPDKAHHRARR